MNQDLSLTKKWYFPIFLYGIYICFISIFIYLTFFGDDTWFMRKYNGLGLKDIIDTLLVRFETKTSRYLIEFTIGIIGAFLGWLWFVVLNIFFFILMLYSYIKLIYDDVKLEYAYILTGICLLFPIMILSTAGWLATCINYLWPASLALYSSLLIKNILLEKSISKVQFTVAIFAFIYAIDALQNSLVLTAITFIVFLYCLYIRKNIKLSLFIFILSFVRMLFHMLSSGNANRFQGEIRYIPNFEMISLVEKVQLGFMQIAANLFYSPNLMVFILCILVFLIIKKRYSDFWIKTISIVPLTIILLFGFFNVYLSQIYNFKIIPFIKGFSTGGKYSGVVTLDNFISVTSYIPLVVAIIVTLFLAVSIYYCLCSKSKLFSLFISLIFLLGIGGGTIMGFSPTIYASGYRTHTIVYLCLMVVIGFVYSRNEDILDGKYKNLFKLVLLICVILSVFIQTIQIMTLYDNTTN